MTELTLRDGATTQATISGAGRPVIFLHGWAMHGGYFDAQRRGLSEEFKVISYDMRAHGRSQSAGGQPTIEQLAADLAEIVGQLDLSDAILVGWSMGAMVAWRAMADERFARRIGGLAVIDMSPRISNDASWNLGLSDGRRPLAAIKAVETMRENWPAMVKRFAPRIFAAGSEEKNRTIIKKMMRDAERLDPLMMASLWESMAVQDFRTTLRMIKTPMLVICGEKSQLYSPQTSEYVAKQAGCGTLERFADCGHAPHIEAPEDFNRRLVRFIEEISSGARERSSSIAAAS